MRCVHVQDGAPREGPLNGRDWRHVCTSDVCSWTPFATWHVSAAVLVEEAAHVLEAPKSIDEREEKGGHSEPMSTFTPSKQTRILG